VLDKSVEKYKMRNQLMTFLNGMKNEIFSDMKGTTEQIAQSATYLTSAAATIEQAGQALSMTTAHLKTAQPSATSAENEATSYE
jgi:hypothetical protein